MGINPKITLFCRCRPETGSFKQSRYAFEGNAEGGRTLSFANFESAKNPEKKDSAPSPILTLPFSLDQKDRKDAGGDAGINKKNDDAAIPERPRDALSGSQFIDRLQQIENQMKAEGKNTNDIRKRREEEIYNQIRSGNIPPNLREFKNVHVDMKDENGQVITGTVRVMPDYIAIGDEKDNVRVPMSPATAQLIANQWGCSLPTTEIVKDVFKQASQNGITLKPRPMKPTVQMMSTDYFVRHNRTVNGQIDQVRSANPTLMDGNPLITGDKKDIVLPYFGEGNRNVVIYGWIMQDGRIIQGYSGGAHENTYADYSHGVRLVAGNMTVRYPDGRTETRSVDSVLNDPKLHRLISRARIPNSSSAYPDNAWTNSFSRSPSAPLPAAPDQVASAGAEVGPPTNFAALPTLNLPGSAPPESGAPVPKPVENVTVPASSPPPAAAPVETTPSGPGDSASRPVTPEDLARPLQGAPPAGGSSGPAARPPSPNIPPAGVSSPYGPSRSTPEPAQPPEPPVAPSGAAAPPPAVTPDTPPASTSPEQREKGPIKGSVLFCGDSISVKMDEQKAINCTGKKETVAKGSQTSQWLLDWVNGKKGEELPNPDILKNFEQVVVLMGTNDIGAVDRPDFTSRAIFNRIEKIWSRMKDINPNIKIYAVTIPPFKGYSFGRYGKEFAVINQRRKEINEMIMGSSIPYGKIDICRQFNPVDPAAGGVATSDDPDEAALHNKARNDKVHPKGNILAQIYQRAVASEAKIYPPPAGQETAVPAPRPRPDTTLDVGSGVLPESGDLYEIPINNPIIEDPGQIRRAKTVDPKEGKGVAGDKEHWVYDDPPAGYRRYGKTEKVPSAALTYLLQKFPDWRHTPINTTIHFVVDGKDHTARIEWHQNSADSNAFLRGTHHGWTMFRKK